jgi:hypothetical protein
MEDEDKVDSVYIKGFNEGYIIARDMPQLAEILAKVESNSERLKGLKAGREQYNHEQIKQLRNLLPGWLKKESSLKSKSSPSRSKDLDRDIEPEK